MKYRELLKASRGLPVKDPIAALWGSRLRTGSRMTSITGTLPLDFTSDGSFLAGCRICGTAAGAGTRGADGKYTIDLAVAGDGALDIEFIQLGDAPLYEGEYADLRRGKIWKRTGNMFDKSTFPFSDTSAIVYVPIRVPEGTYTMSSDIPDSGVRDVFFLSGNVSSGANSNANGVSSTRPRTREAVNGYLTVATRYNSARPDPADFSFVIVSGSEPADPSIPYLRPADPPAPFPSIQTFAGSNRLTSSETLGTVTIRGHIEQL